MLANQTSVSPQQTLQERASEATSRLKKILHLQELSTADLKRLSLAIAEIAAEEAEANLQFAQRISHLYEDLAPSKKKVKKDETLYTGEDLIPIASAVGYQINVYGPPEPEKLLKIFGKEQLPKALSLFKPTKLKEAALRLMEEHPGTKPRTKTKPDDLIEYIVTQVTQERT